MFNLGDKLKDTITGFTGVVVAKTEWLNGCRRYSLQSEKLKDGSPLPTEAFDEEQLRLVKAKKLPVGSPSGGPMPEPARHSEPKARR